MIICMNTEEKEFKATLYANNYYRIWQSILRRTTRNINNMTWKGRAKNI